MLLKGFNRIKKDFISRKLKFESKEKRSEYFGFIISFYHYFKKQIKVDADLLKLGLNNVDLLLNDSKENKNLNSLKRNIVQNMTILSTLLSKQIELNMENNLKNERIIYVLNEKQQIKDICLYVKKHCWFYDQHTYKTHEEENENYSLCRKLIKYLGKLKMEDFPERILSQHEDNNTKVLKDFINKRFPMVKILLKPEISENSHVDMEINKIGVEVKKINSKTDFDTATGQIFEDLRQKFEKYSYGIIFAIDETQSRKYLRFNRLMFFKDPKVIIIIRENPYIKK